MKRILLFATLLLAASMPVMVSATPGPYYFPWTGQVSPYLPARPMSSEEAEIAQWMLGYLVFIAVYAFVRLRVLRR